MRSIANRIILVTIIATSSFMSARAWSEHPLLAYPVLSTFTQLNNSEPIPVLSLQSFLIEHENQLEKVLQEYEVWAKENLDYYAPLPENLRFQATGNPDDILERFFFAIRLNPNVKMQLYLHLLPSEEVGDRLTVDPKKLTTLSDVSSMQNTNYVQLSEGEMVSPLSVLCTANDEPDYGFDLGLFEDNDTPQGDIYGFGLQPFGDPNLEYGSQAPFHMGFYHEPKIVFFFGPFLKKTMPEFRISLFKTLSEFAFENESPYWGFRFMGWGMHYLGDLSMPYHAAPLPGISAIRMIWINLKAMIGFPKSKDNAVQLVSNKHSVLEEFQWQQIKSAYSNGYENHPLILALQNPIEYVEYSDDFPRSIAAKESVKRAKKVNKGLKKWIPKRLVSDPKFEVPGSPELGEIVEITRQEKGEEAVENMTLMLSNIFSSYSMHIQSYYKAIVNEQE